MALEYGTVDDASERVEHLRDTLKALLMLLDNAKPHSRRWHESIAKRIERINDLYPTPTYALGRSFGAALGHNERRDDATNQAAHD